MKLLLYCTKSKPSLMKYETIEGYYTDTDTVLDKRVLLNGKILAECDFEVEKIELLGDEINIYYGIENKACLTTEQIENYLGYDNDYKGYAIHIKNLHIFDKPKELDYYYSRPKKVNTFDWYRLKGYTYANISLDKAPQNMMYAFDEKEREYILISIRPEWLCKILNGEKTIEVRKKVLKEMLNNE